MPPATRRLSRATKLVKLYIQHQRFYKMRRARRKAFLDNLNQVPGPQLHLTSSSLSDLSSTTEGSDMGSDAQSDPNSASSGNWLGDSSDSDLFSDFDGIDFDAPLGHDDLEDITSDDSSGWSADIDSVSGASDGDDKESIAGEDEWVRPHFQSFVRSELGRMFAHRYEVPRNQHPRGPSLMQFVLNEYKTLRPDLFRQDLRVSPDTFDKIVEMISGHPVFSNNSNNPQCPVGDQLAIALFCFGHYGNAASLERVRKWAATSKGLVKLATRRVMTALLSSDFMKLAVRLPTDEEKEDAKNWVEEHSCKAWRDGWCLVDGTLIPLYNRPYWYGESYFDRKCNYSLNIQVSHLYLGRVALGVVTPFIDCVTAKSPYYRLQLWAHREHPRLDCLGGHADCSGT